MRTRRSSSQAAVAAAAAAAAAAPQSPHAPPLSEQLLPPVIRALRSLFMALSNEEFESECEIEGKRRGSMHNNGNNVDILSRHNNNSNNGKKRALPTPPAPAAVAAAPADNNESDQNKKKTKINNKNNNDMTVVIPPGHDFGKKFVLLNPGVAERIARTIDLSSQESIAKPEHFSHVANCGNLNVPLHIRAYSRCIFETLAKIRQFRHKSIEAQQLECDYANRLSRSECEFLHRRISLVLEKEQKSLTDEWQAACNAPPPPLPTQSPSLLAPAPPASLPAVAVTKTITTQLPNNNLNNKVAAAVRSVGVPPVSAAVARATTANTTTHVVKKKNPSPMIVNIYNGSTVSTTTTTTPTTVTNSSSGSNGKPLATVHKVGEFATTLTQQYDKIVRDAESVLLRTFAKFNDTCYFPDAHHEKDDPPPPTIRSVLMIFNEVVEQRIAGGGNTISSKKKGENWGRRKHPKFTLVARSKDDVQRVLTAYNCAFNILHHDDYFTEYIAAASSGDESGGDQKLATSVAEKLQMDKERRRSTLKLQFPVPPLPPPSPPPMA